MSTGEPTVVPQETSNDVVSTETAQEAPEVTQHALPHGDHEYVVATARGIVTNELMIADLTNQAWQISLALMIEKLAEIPNLGLILVPLLPHAHLHWVNGTAPGMTMQCQLVAREDLDALHEECERMYAALHPNEPPITKDNNNEQDAQ